MSKIWTYEEDKYIACYYGIVSDCHISRDLGRPEGSVNKRVKKLKECGAWDVLKVINALANAYHVSLGREGDIDEEELRVFQFLIDECTSLSKAIG